MTEIVELHQVYRLLDLDVGQFIVYCRDCAFAQVRDSNTLELLWFRQGDEGTRHAGGNSGLRVWMDVDGAG